MVVGCAIFKQGKSSLLAQMVGRHKIGTLSQTGWAWFAFGVKVWHSSGAATEQNLADDQSSNMASMKFESRLLVFRLRRCMLQSVGRITPACPYYILANSMHTTMLAKHHIGPNNTTCFGHSVRLEQRYKGQEKSARPGNYQKKTRKRPSCGIPGEERLESPCGARG